MANLLSKFIFNGTNIEIVDSTARSSATSASQVATAAKTVADSAKSTADANKTDIAALQKLSRVSMAYDSATETITVTTGDHDAT